MSENSSSKSSISIGHFAVIAVFVLAISITLTFIFSKIGDGDGFFVQFSNILRQISIIIATALTVVVSFERIKKFKSKGWLWAFIVAVIIVVVFLVLDFVGVIQALV